MKASDYFVQYCAKKFEYHNEIDSILERYTKSHSRRHRKIKGVRGQQLHGISTFCNLSCRNDVSQGCLLKDYF